MGESLAGRQVNWQSHCALELPQYIAAGDKAKPTAPSPLEQTWSSASYGSVIPRRTC